MENINEEVLKDIELLLKKKVIMEKYRISSSEYKTYYALFISRKQEQKEKVAYAIKKPIENLSKFSNEALTELLDLDECVGVYFLYKGNTIVYVGVSKNLKNRIPTSIDDKVGINGFSYICTDSLSDAYILEVMLINIIQPYWNSASIGWGKVSFDLPSKYDYKDLEILR